MKPVERAALIDRVARAITWDQLSQDTQNRRRQQAGRIVDELLTGYEQNQRIGWVFINTDSEPEPVE